MSPYKKATGRYALSGIRSQPTFRLGSLKVKKLDGWVQFRVDLGGRGRIRDEAFVEIAEVPPDRAASGKTEIWLYEIEIPKHYQGQGHSETIIKALLTYAKQQGYSETIHIHHPWNRSYWEKMAKRYSIELET